MGYEHDTYFFDRRGQMTSNREDASVIAVHSVEHDVYGNPSFEAEILDLEGAKEALPLLRPKRPHKECHAIADAVRRRGDTPPRKST